MTQALQRILFACVAVFLTATFVFAQTISVDYEAWNRTAVRGEQAIEAGMASDTAFENLRGEVATWRDQFTSAQDENGQRIATLRTQIETLGEVPEDGTEPEEISLRRVELNDQLARLTAPVLRAEEAYSRADGIIREIDSILRSRKADKLLSLGPSPINPVHWSSAIEQMLDAMSSLVSEVQTSWQSPNQRAQFQANLPVILGLVVLAIVMVWRGRHWIERLVGILRARTRPGTGVWSFIVSLGQIALPYVGIYALTQALFATGFLGLRGTLLLEQVPQWALLLLFVRWLSDQTFPKSSEESRVFVLEPARRTEARYYVNILAGLLVFREVLTALEEFENFSTATRSVLDFPVIVLSALFLFRLGMILRTASNQDETADESDSQKFKARMIRFLGQVALAISFVAPVLAAIGYGGIGNGLVVPALLTIVLFGTLLVLIRFTNDLYCLITKKDPTDAEGLIPVLAGFSLTLLAFPVLALIWGARVTDITELWARAREGFAIGDSRISLTDFLTFIVVFIVGYTLTRLLQSGLKTSVLPKTKIDPGGRNALVSGVGYIGIFLAALVAITTAGVDLSSLAIVAGALSVGIGFGLQNIVSNFVSGIILLIERPISEGDWIEVGGQQGYVRDISVRSTRIETFDRTDVIVPNADLVSGTVTNFTRGNSIGRVIVPVGVAYGTDTRFVEKILTSIAREHPRVLLNPAPSVIFQGFGADSLDFEIRAILSDVNYVLSVKSEMNFEIEKRFREAGIEIPFAQRDVWLRNPEALSLTEKDQKDDG